MADSTGGSSAGAAASSSRVKKSKAKQSPELKSIKAYRAKRPVIVVTEVGLEDLRGLIRLMGMTPMEILELPTGPWDKYTGSLEYALPNFILDVCFPEDIKKICYARLNITMDTWRCLARARILFLTRDNRVAYARGCEHCEALGQVCYYKAGAESCPEGIAKRTTRLAGGRVNEKWTAEFIEYLDYPDRGQKGQRPSRHRAGAQNKDRYSPRVVTGARVVKMVNALNEHFFVSTFNSLNGDYPLVCLLFGAAWPHRRFKQVNAVVPAVQFVDRSKKAEKGKGWANQTGDKAAPPPAKKRVVTAHALINEPLPVLYAPGPCASTREALKIVEECHLRLDTPMAGPSSSPAVAADSDLVIEDIPFDIAAFKEPTSQRTFEAAIDYARYQIDEDQDTIDFAEDPVTGGISASSASSPSRRGAQRPREPRTTLIAPLLPDVARKAIRQRICFAGGVGFPFEVVDGRLELQTGFVKVGTISLSQDHLWPCGRFEDGTSGTFYVELERGCTA